MSDKTAISVFELTQAISEMFDSTFGYVRVEGEISNYKLHSSGHRYFTLKDDKSQILCTMWKSKKLNFVPTEGMKVIISGKVTVYPPRGQYQIECETMTPVSIGELYLAYEALKQKLSAAGYFDELRKRNLPDLPLTVGISTSPTGAAIRDIISTIERRFPAMTIYFRPTLCQGEGSPEDIVDAIHELELAEPDVIIIGRGGGSIEDLWAYNTETVADAIYSSKIPIISAVGHETDFTIADFVADLRAATPTAAAEIVTPFTRINAISVLDNTIKDLNQYILSKIDNLNIFIQNTIKSYAFRQFQNRVLNYQQLADNLESEINKEILSKLRNLQQKSAYLESHLNSLNPFTPLERGFALLKSENRFIKNTETLGNFIEIDILRKDEFARAQIVQVKKNYLNKTNIQKKHEKN